MYFKQLLIALTLIFLSHICHAQSTSNDPPKKNGSTQITLPEPSASARDLFSRYKDRLLQVRVLLNSASEQSSLGSGFVVRDDGIKGAWVLTNYHVISSLAIDPEKYRIELRGTNGRNVKAQLMAVDVIHDLAVLRTEPNPDVKPWSVFSLREPPLMQGSKIFSLGNPLELGFLISEGIYNGLVESRVYDQMLFSGALNSGMSGGPAIDEQGRVVGVNVSARRDGEQLSFLVPVKYARDLLVQAFEASPSKEWRKTITKQLLSHQDFLTSKLLAVTVPSSSSTPTTNFSASKTKAGFSSQILAGRTVPTLDGDLTKCWAKGKEGEKSRYQRDSLNCDLSSNLFVRDSLYTGTMSLQHTLLRNEKLTTPQFLTIHEYGSGNNNWRSRSEKTASECTSSYMQSAKHIYRISLCLYAYKKFEDIYDYSITATQIDDSRERLTSIFELQGFSFQNSQNLARLFLERLQ